MKGKSYSESIVSLLSKAVQYGLNEDKLAYALQKNLGNIKSLHFTKVINLNSKVMIKE